MSTNVTVDTLATEANSTHSKLKDLMESFNPSNKEVESQCKRLRNELRRLYECLLILHTYAPESREVESHLWTQTSYSFINAYKERIKSLDQPSDSGRSNQPSTQGRSGPIEQSSDQLRQKEYRKVLQKFQQLLSEESKYWSLLLLRLCRMFSLDEARQALVTLEILSNSSASFSDAVSQFQILPAPTWVPEELEEKTSPPSSDVERDSLIFIVVKILVYLGDIARYKELYNDSNGRPRAGHHDNIPAKIVRKRNGEPRALAHIAHRRDYSKAKQFYEQAQALYPAYGQPYYQLGIVAAWDRKTFFSHYYYYRALSVAWPAESAEDSLNRNLKAALDTWISKDREKRAQPVKELGEVERLDAFRERLLVLHALWKVGLEEGYEKMEALSPLHRQMTYEDCHFLLSDCQLPAESLIKAVIMSQSALYRLQTQLSRDPSPRVAISADDLVLIEYEIFMHILDLHRALLDVARQQLKRPIPIGDDAEYAAQRISSTFWRMFPSLRVAGRWLRANYDFITTDPEFLAYCISEGRTNNKVYKSRSGKLSAYSLATRNFWEIYADFIRILSQKYMKGNLPKQDPQMNEDKDNDLEGFLPLKFNEEGSGHVGEKRPNEVQLARVWDILEDANAIARLPNSPIQRVRNVIITRGLEEDPQSPVLGQERDAMKEDDDLLRETVDTAVNYSSISSSLSLRTTALPDTLPRDFTSYAQALPFGTSTSPPHNSTFPRPLSPPRAPPGVTPKALPASHNVLGPSIWSVSSDELAPVPSVVNHNHPHVPSNRRPSESQPQSAGVQQIQSHQGGLLAPTAGAAGALYTTSPGDVIIRPNWGSYPQPQRLPSPPMQSFRGSTRNQPHEHPPRASLQQQAAMRSAPSAIRSEVRRSTIGGSMNMSGAQRRVESGVGFRKRRREDEPSQAMAMAIVKDVFDWVLK